MGGHPPEEASQEAKTVTTAQPGTAVETTKASSEELERATIEIIKLESKLDRLEDYLDLLSKKIVKARASNNVKKIIELKGKEQEATAQAEAVKQKIAKLREKYPELKEQAGTEAAAPSEEAQTPRAVTPNIVYHEVVMGDTLMNISRKYFNTPAHYKEIAKMNNITGNTGLSQGMILKIDLDWARGVKQEAKVEVKKPASAGGIVYHTVAPGDTLMSISRKYYGTPLLYKDIAAMNGITDLGQLKVGMKLKIDKGR